MAENLEEVRQDRAFWQRLMRFAGYYKGEIDGIIGRQSQAAAAAWQSAAETHRAELGSFDERSERNIATHTPETQRLARLWLSQAKAAAQAEGMDVRIICGTRTYKEQDALYRKRPRVTKARGGQSMHNFGIAWDIGIFKGKDYFGDHALYGKLGKLHADIPGLTWGGTWTSFVDQPHYQLNTFGSTAAARKRFEA